MLVMRGTDGQAPTSADTLPSMLLRLAPALLLLALAAPAAARAADPIMPLGDVRAGMRCAGYSVLRGTEISSFDAEVIDVVEGDPTLNGPRILVQASGAAVKDSGIGPGFSGSPIYCSDAAGTPRVIGAISESIGEYGGRIVLANPIEAILGAGAEAPTPRPVRPGSSARAQKRGRASALLARGVKPLATPLTATGLTAPVARALQAAGRKAGRPVLAAPAGPLAPFPVQPLVPGAAMGVGYADGDLSISAIGTVAYADGNRVWGFGHPFEGAGRRALLLQDAYVYRVIANPNVTEEVGTTYKLASAGHSVGTLSNDALDAVVGRVGGLPSVVPVTAEIADLDTNRRQEISIRVADETDVEFPTGPNLPVIAPLAVADGIVRTVRSTPPRLSGTMCARIALRERQAPLRFCNRYVGGQSGDGESEDEELGSGIASSAGADLLEALSLIDGYERDALHVTGVHARVRVTRGQRELALRSVALPHRVRPGQRVRVRLTVQAPRGAHSSFTVPWRIPRGLARGTRTLTFKLAERAARRGFDEGMAEELGDEEFGGSDRPAQERLAASRRGVEGVARRVGALSRYDGLVVRAGGEELHFYRDPEVLITGRARATVRVARPQKR